MLMMNPRDPTYFWSNEFKNTAPPARSRECRSQPRPYPSTLWSDEANSTDYIENNLNRLDLNEQFDSRFARTLERQEATGYIARRFLPIGLDNPDNHYERNEMPSFTSHLGRRSLRRPDLEHQGDYLFSEATNNRFVPPMEYPEENYTRQDSLHHTGRHLMTDSFSNPSPRQMESNPMGMPKMEQMNLQNQLYVAYHSQNVKDTVSLLRKIYTKQFKGFRIPSVLKNIRRDSKPDEMILTDLLFTLECIQWCFGGQKTYEPESFTYKMNCYVAQCLLEDTQKRSVPSFLTSDAIQMAIITAQSILKQVPEFELALEILEWVGVPDPGSVMISYLNIWNKSTNPAVVFRARRFVSEFSKLAMPKPRLIAPPTVGPDLTVVRERLYNLLSHFPSGVLGARIPELYLTEYHEPMDLHRQKLKDILLSLQNVKMTSVRGSGDKIFSIVGLKGVAVSGINPTPSVMYHYPDRRIDRDIAIEYKQF